MYISYFESYFSPYMWLMAAFTKLWRWKCSVGWCQSNPTSFLMTPLASWAPHQSLHWCVPAQLVSCVQLFVTPWTVAHQVCLSMGFSRQEYWSGLPCLLPGDLLTQELNQHLLCLLNRHLGSLRLAPPRKPPGKLSPISYFITLGSFAYGFQRHEQKMSQIGLILQNKLNWALFVWLGFYYLLGEFLNWFSFGFDFNRM